MAIQRRTISKHEYAEAALAENKVVESKAKEEVEEAQRKVEVAIFGVLPIMRNNRCPLNSWWGMCMFANVPDYIDQVPGHEMVQDLIGQVFCGGTKELVEMR